MTEGFWKNRPCRRGGEGLWSEESIRSLLRLGFPDPEPSPELLDRVEERLLHRARALAPQGDWSWNWMTLARRQTVPVLAYLALLATSVSAGLWLRTPIHVINPTTPLSMVQMQMMAHQTASRTERPVSAPIAAKASSAPSTAPTRARATAPTRARK